MSSGSSNREIKEQIPKEDDTQGKTGEVISEQAGIEGQRKEANVESYAEVAQVGQILKDIKFPTNKQKIIEHIRQQQLQSSNIQNKENILTKLQEKLEEREYKNVSDITTSAGLVY
jgi:hypothetical protein